MSATRSGGLVDEVTVEAEKGGVARIKWPFKTYFVKAQKGVILKKTEGDLVELTMQKGGKIILKNGYE